MGAGPIILRTENLSVGYPEKVLFQGVNLTLPASGITCIIGPNGQGKTTLIRTLAGIHDPIAGKVELDGIDLQSIEALELAKKRSVVLTHRPDVDSLKVEDLLKFGRYPFLKWYQGVRTTDQELIDKVIGQCHLENLRYRELGQLSDGEKQRVMIGRALVQDAPLMMLDEPASHLDVSNQVFVLNLLRGLADQDNKTIVFSSHDLQLSLQIADHIWLVESSGISSISREAFDVEAYYSQLLDGSSGSYQQDIGGISLS